MEDNKFTIICQRIEDRNPQTKGTEKNCQKCGEKVWLSDTSEAIFTAEMVKNPSLEVEAICLQCALPLLIKNPTILPPSEEQINEITNIIEKERGDS